MTLESSDFRTDLSCVTPQCVFPSWKITEEHTGAQPGFTQVTRCGDQIFQPPSQKEDLPSWGVGRNQALDMLDLYRASEMQKSTKNSTFLPCQGRHQGSWSSCGCFGVGLGERNIFQQRWKMSLSVS